MDISEFNPYVSNFNKQTFNISAEEVYAVGNAMMEAAKKGGRLHFCGVGKTSYVAGYAAALISSTGITSYSLDATEVAHGSAGQLGPNDVVVFISNSGETSETLKALMVTKAKSNNTPGFDIKTVSITKKNSSLGKLTDFCINAEVEDEGGPWNKAPRKSINLENSIIQLLSIYLQLESKFTKRDYLLNHSSGSIGKSLEAEAYLDAK